MTEPHIPVQYEGEGEFEYTEDDMPVPRRNNEPPPDPDKVLREKAQRVDMEKLLRRVLEKRISEAVDAAIQGRIEKEVSAIFDEGWVATNDWGEPENGGKRVGIRERISAMLTEKTDRYSRHGVGVHNIIRKGIETKLEVICNEEQASFKKELAKWKKEKMTERLRAALDGSIF